MFVSRAGGDLLVAESGMSKKWLMLAAEALRRPAEIWVRLDWVESLKRLWSVDVTWPACR